MILATTGVAVMLYLDRACLGILDEQIKPLLADTPAAQAERFGDLSSAFFWAYAACQVPAGWLGDRYGARRVLPAYLFLWSVCTGLMGLAGGFAALFVLRLLCGAFEAGAYPLAAGIVRRWVPAAARGLASGVVAVGGRLGMAAAPTLTVALAAATAYGWRAPFVVYGLVGVIGAGLFYLWFRDRPDRHPAVNRAEAELIAGGAPPPPAAPVGWPPVGAFVLSRALWLNSLVQFLANFAWVFILALFPTYLREVYGTAEQTRAVYQTLPVFGGIVGMLLGGWVSDRLVRRYGLRWGRAAPVAASRLVVGGAYLACPGLADPLAVTAMMVLVAWATDAGTAPVWAWGQDVGGRQVGAVIGWANMWGNLGAAVAPMAFVRIRGAFDDPAAGWNAVFLLCACTQVVAAVAALGIDARRPIAGRSEGAGSGPGGPAPGDGGRPDQPGVGPDGGRDDR
jgi:ACS family glucarate transporter-like MFS transporter